VLDVSTTAGLVTIGFILVLFMVDRSKVRATNLQESRADA